MDNILDFLPKIVILTENFRLNHLGGAETSIFLIAKGLSNLGANVSIITFGEFDKDDFIIVDNKLKIITISPNTTPGKRNGYSKYQSKLYLNKILKCINNEKPDMIQTHIINNTIQLSGLKFIMRKLIIIPFTITFHDFCVICTGDFKCKKQELRSSEYTTIGLFKKPSLLKCIWCCKNIRKAVFRRKSLRFINQHFKKIYYVSGFTRKIYEDNGAGPSLGRVLYNGIDNLGFTQKTFNPYNNKINIITGGRMKFKKGYHQVIYALAELPLDVVSRISLTIYGEDNNYCTYLKDIARKLHLDNNINFTGWLSKKDLKQLRDKAHIAIIPSLLSDPLPRVIYEYISSGILVIGTRTGGTKEVIEHGVTGFLIDPYNVKEIAELLSHVLRHPYEVKRLTSAAKDVVEKNFRTIYNSKQRLIDCIDITGTVFNVNS